MTFQEFIYTAITNAQRGGMKSSSNAEFIAQTLFDEVAQGVSEAIAANEYRRPLLRRQKTITLSAGQATLDDDVLVHYMADAELLNTANLNQHYAWRDYPDFVRRGDKRIGIFTVPYGHIIQVIDPMKNFTQPLIASGDRLLTTPCCIVKPASYTTAIDAPAEAISDLTEAMSNALCGQASKVAGEAV